MTENHYNHVPMVVYIVRSMGGNGQKATAKLSVNWIVGGVLT
jgi:hypothetical protein